MVLNKEGHIIKAILQDISGITDVIGRICVWCGSRKKERRKVET